MPKLFLLDFDGTLTEPFSNTVLPGVRERVRFLQQQGCFTAVVTNQAGPLFHALVDAQKYPTARDVARMLSTGMAAAGLGQVVYVCVAPPSGYIHEPEWRTTASVVARELRFALHEYLTEPTARWVVSDDPQDRKPAGGLIARAVRGFQRLGIGPSDTTYVGDLASDRAAAEAAGVAFLDAAAWRQGG